MLNWVYLYIIHNTLNLKLFGKYNIVQESMSIQIPIEHILDYVSQYSDARNQIYSI